MVESIEGSFASGQELAEQYVIQQPLGSSDGGEVYLAEDRATGRQVALKLFMPPVHERIRIEELQAEIEAAKTLTHKNMVQVYGLGQASGRAFVVLEYIDGQTLSERIAKRRSSGRAFSAKVVFNIIAHICSALQRVHETTVHGALTPGNVYLDQKSKVKVGNLVYGRMVATALSPEGVSLFHDSPFVAPEVQASGGRALTPAADIYALALMTMDLLSPEPLGGSAEEVLGRARVLAEKTGDGLHQLIAHATASDPAVRLANAGEFRDRLKETIAGRPRAAVQAAPERAPAPQVVAATPEVLAMSTPEVAQEEELGMALPPFVAPEPAPSQPLSLEPQPLAPDFAHEEEVALDDPFARAAAVLGKGREQSLELRLSGGEDDGDRGEARYLVSRDGLDYGPYTVQEVVDQLHKDEITENTLILDRVTQERVPMRSMRVFSKAVKEYVPIREERLRIKQEQREAVVQTAKTAGRWTAYSGV
ncbi:MAG: protein kinase, partial [Myxococcota bacterium]